MFLFLIVVLILITAITRVTRVVQARVPIEIQDVVDKIIRLSGLTVSDVVRVIMTRIAQDKSIPT